MKFTLNRKKLALQGLRPPINSLEKESKLNKSTLVEGRGLWLQLIEAKETDIPRVCGYTSGFRTIPKCI